MRGQSSNMTEVGSIVRFPAATKVLVIMPAWNERACIGNTVHEVIDLGRDYDVLVVDDGSDDGTAELAEAAGAHVLRLPFNLGVGGAMRAGFKFPSTRRSPWVRIEAACPPPRSPLDTMPPAK